MSIDNPIKAFQKMPNIAENFGEAILDISGWGNTLSVSITDSKIPSENGIIGLTPKTAVAIAKRILEVLT